MTDIKIGSRVRFLSDVGGGKVVGFQKGNIVLVEDEDGFQIPTLMSDVVVIETEDYNTSTMVDVKKKQKVPSLPTQEEKKAVTPSKKTPIHVDTDLEPADRPITFKPKVEERKDGEQLGELAGRPAALISFLAANAGVPSFVIPQTVMDPNRIIVSKPPEETSP